MIICFFSMWLRANIFRIHKIIQIHPLSYLIAFEKTQNEGVALENASVNYVLNKYRTKSVKNHAWYIFFVYFWAWFIPKNKLGLKFLNFYSDSKPPLWTWIHWSTLFCVGQNKNWNKALNSNNTYMHLYTKFLNKHQQKRIFFSPLINSNIYTSTYDTIASYR